MGRRTTVISLIEEKRGILEEMCRRYHVERLEIFGSAAGGEFRPESSDLDFLVAFHPSSDMNIADQYFGLWEDLRKLFNRDVDLVIERAMKNPYFIKAVNNTRKIVYAA